MKTLKITLALVAVIVLTLSGVQSETNLSSDQNEIKQSTKIDLLAHTKKGIKVPSHG